MRKINTVSRSLVIFSLTLVLSLLSIGGLMSLRAEDQDAFPSSGTEMAAVETGNDSETSETGSTETTETTETEITETDPVILSTEHASLSDTSFTYTGSEITPDALVQVENETLTEDIDYILTYTDNVNAGTAKATISGIGRYTGDVEIPFTISPRNISKLPITLSRTTYTYNGGVKRPKPTLTYESLTLKKTRDYTVTYLDNINAGKATVVVTGTGNYTGTRKAKFHIARRSITNCSISLSKTSYTYTGQKLQPAVRIADKSVSLAEGTDYKLSVKNNKNPGIATVTIKGLGNYYESDTKTFKILPDQPNVYNITHEGKKLILTWDADKRSTGFEIYRRSGDSKWSLLKKVTATKTSYTDSATGSYGDSYKYRMRAYVKSEGKIVYGPYSKVISAKVQNGAVEIASITPASNSSFVLTWVSQDNADGYLIYRRLNNSSKWTKVKTIEGGVKTTYTDSGLKYGKTYTYTIQAYRKSGDKTVKGARDENGLTVKLAYTSKYKDGYKLYYDAAGKIITNVEGIIGKQSSYHIKVNKKANVVTVYAKDGENGYIIPVKVFLCSAGGSNTPVGTFYTPEKYRWHTLNHNVEGQWCTRIHDGVLFHSVWYYSRSKTDLTTVQYNRLGNTASAGCVRVNCESAKWIYDNCSLGTAVTIYESDNPGPLGKPKALIIPSWHTWDPTDPTCADLCKKHGCH